MSKHKASCHCGNVELEIELPEGLQNLRRCNCSLCRRKGAVMASVPEQSLTVVRGTDSLGEYRWNTGIARHFFCCNCGIYTHHRRRSNPEEMGFNVGCLEEVDPLTLEGVGVGDGASLTLVPGSEQR